MPLIIENFRNSQRNQNLHCTSRELRISKFGTKQSLITQFVSFKLYVDIQSKIWYGTLNIRDRLTFDRFCLLLYLNFWSRQRILVIHFLIILCFVFISEMDWEPKKNFHSSIQYVCEYVILLIIKNNMQCSG